MRFLVVLAAVLTVSLAKSVTLLKRSELTDELINNPRYLLWEAEEGLFDVEDLYSNETSGIPLSVSERDVTFYVFTPQNSRRGVQIRQSQVRDIVRLTGFNITRPTLVVIHGWQNRASSAVSEQIKNAALARNIINVIVVDWSPIARKSYTIAQRSVVDVGNFIGDFLLKLDNELGYQIRKVTIAGHSLGAHISGNVGARTKGLIETIIGLDPAGPLFSQRNINNRLDPTDAKYVEVMHTNDGELGFNIIMGHADYYPNGGKSQAGCGPDIGGLCAHNRAFKYFAESLTSDRFTAQLCDTYTRYQRNSCSQNTVSKMGGYPVTNKRHGTFFLNTNRASPYARG